MFQLMALPYADNALAPVVSPNTIGFHYGKHHKTYVDNLNNLVKGTDLEGKSLEEVVMATAGKADKAPLFNNSAQIWNHDFYWKSLKPNGGGVPSRQGRGQDQRILRQLRGVQEATLRHHRLAVRQRLGLARRRCRRQAEGGEDGQRRGADHAGPEAAAHHRRVGARLLPRSPESPRRLRERGDRQAAQLGIRGGESRSLDRG